MLASGASVAAPQQQRGAPAPDRKTDQMAGGQMTMPAMTAMKANTERLDALMSAMKDAAGEKKVAAMAEIIGIFVEERAAMAAHCAKMRTMMEK
jgi:hypothetical protein